MKSLTVPSRKRPHSPGLRESDDSDSNAPPCKLKRQNNKEFPSTLKAKLTDIVEWLSELPLKSYFRMAVSAALKVHGNFDILEDDEVILDDDHEVITIEEDEERESTPERLTPLIEKLKSLQKFPAGDSKRHSKKMIDHRNGSHPYSFGTFNHNGYTENGRYSPKKPQTDMPPAVISNPLSEFDLLLGSTPKASAKEADCVEIVSESSIPKRQSSSKKYSHSLSAANYSTMSHSSSTKNSSLSSPKDFTANEVVRLEEKAQYKLLLEKVMGGSRYTSVKKPQPDPVEQAYGRHLLGYEFKKERQQPVSDFIETICKPRHILADEKKEPAAEEKEEPVEITIDDDEEEEIQIVNMKLPTHAPKFRATLFTSEWLSELKTEIETVSNERMKIIEDHERLVEKYKKERLLKRLSIDVGSQVVEPDFPELTPEMEEAVDAALRPGADQEERLCKITSDFLTRKDFETLNGLHWLNDLVINSYFDLIVARSKQEGYPTVHAYNTFFYGTYKTKGYASVRRWTRKIDIFSFDLNFVPIHLGVHWCLAAIDHRSKRIRYYDSMGTGEEKCLDLLHEYLCLEHKDKKGLFLDPSAYSTEVMKDIPQQMNGSDCGMFTLKYAEYISRDAEINFDQDNMQYFRRRMVFELLSCQLL